MSKKNSNDNLEIPSSLLKHPSAEIIANLQLISEVFQKIEEETAEIAEMIFDYLINASDLQIMKGELPEYEDEYFPEEEEGISDEEKKKRAKEREAKKKRINGYLSILNRLFLFSRKSSQAGEVGGSVRIINRKTVEDLDKKTFTICMCYDGGVSLDILCDIVNTENQARTPTRSPVKITVKQVFAGISHDDERSQ